MTFATQPNGSSVVPLAGAPLIPRTTSNVTAQTETTFVQNNNGVNDSSTIKVIAS